MKPTTNGHTKKPVRPRRVSPEQFEQELERAMAEDQVAERDFEQNVELEARFAAERLHLEIQHRDRVRALETQHQVDLAKLDALQALELVKLWRKQGRQ